MEGQASRVYSGQGCTHANGHKVAQGDAVPQVVKVAVAEEELGGLEKRRLVLGPRRVLERTHLLRIVSAGGSALILGFNILLSQYPSKPPA